MLEKISKFLFFLTYLFPIVSARLPISDMFNYEKKKYIPYIIVSVILLIAFTPISQLRKVRAIIALALNIFTLIIFPPLFFYTTQGFSKLTIVVLALILAITASILISIILRLLISDESKKKIASITFAVLFTLIIAIFPPLFLYATESFNNVTITFLILFEIFIFTTALAVLSTSSCIFKFVVMSFLMGSLMAIIIYAIVLWIKFLVNSGFHISIIVLVINCVVGCFLGFLQGTIIGFIITSNILGGINFYFVFYALQIQVNPISLLLFWAVLWTILFNIYTGIENYGGGAEEGAEAEFDLENYMQK
ncbi:6863_t:CDS:1 [Diversispora eburnea]|uniref:6863_t:CDS:1 n=1 Tax=Diversispora eburnea TaxID=1213867 RepID=A0A9N8YQR1_9GLOM|nr:6863_t:CDS:1 [Diversispora eburnea]